ncbi:MAG TPA: hypothetical protein VMU15_07865 [Anaeromyxobacter sp.]|nr:hypothetical protein [Anaeromyxobacter sp.]
MRGLVAVPASRVLLAEDDPEAGDLAADVREGTAGAAVIDLGLPGPGGRE